MAEKDLLKYKILLLGPPAVGKTSLWNQFINQTFKEDYTETIGVQISVKELTFRNAIVSLNVFDIGGQARFKDLRKNFYKGTEGALLVFDLTREKTFYELEDWITELNGVIGKEVPFLLIGNKSDLIKKNRKFKPDTAKSFTKMYKTPYVEASAKTGEGVRLAFRELIVNIVSSQRHPKDKSQETKESKTFNYENIEKIKELKELLDMGAITQSEFEYKKRELLKGF